MRVNVLHYSQKLPDTAFTTIARLLMMQRVMAFAMQGNHLGGGWTFPSHQRKRKQSG
jgi:hypothetical protein